MRMSCNRSSITRSGGPIGVCVRISSIEGSLATRGLIEDRSVQGCRPRNAGRGQAAWCREFVRRLRSLRGGSRSRKRSVWVARGMLCGSCPAFAKILEDVHAAPPALSANGDDGQGKPHSGLARKPFPERAGSGQVRQRRFWEAVSAQIECRAGQGDLVCLPS